MCAPVHVRSIMTSRASCERARMSRGDGLCLHSPWCVRRVCSDGFGRTRMRRHCVGLAGKQTKRYGSMWRTVPRRDRVHTPSRHRRGWVESLFGRNTSSRRTETRRFRCCLTAFRVTLGLRCFRPKRFTRSSQSSRQSSIKFYDRNSGWLIRHYCRRLWSAGHTCTSIIRWLVLDNVYTAQSTMPYILGNGFHRVVPCRKYSN